MADPDHPRPTRREVRCLRLLPGSPLLQPPPLVRLLLLLLPRESSVRSDLTAGSPRHRRKSRKTQTGVRLVVERGDDFAAASLNVTARLGFAHLAKTSLLSAVGRTLYVV